MKAYIRIWDAKEKRNEKVVWTLEEAQKNLSKKNYERLVSFGGIHTAKYNGYVV